MDFTKRKFKFIFCEWFALVTIKSKVLTWVSLYHNVKKTPPFFIMRFTILVVSCFLAHSGVKEHAQCIPVGMDFGKTATTSNVDGTEYAVYAAPFGCRVWIPTFLVSSYSVNGSRSQKKLWYNSSEIISGTSKLILKLRISFGTMWKYQRSNTL